MKKFIMHLNRQQHTFHLVTVSPWPIIMFLVTIIIFAIYTAHAYGVLADETLMFRFSEEQLDRLRALYDRASSRSLDNLLFDKVQRWVLNYFPQLHQASLDARQSGVELDGIKFLRDSPVWPPDSLRYIPKDKQYLFFEIYSKMLNDYASLLEAFHENRDIDPNLVKRFLEESSQADYLLNHSKFLSMVEMEKVALIHDTVYVTHFAYFII